MMGLSCGLGVGLIALAWAASMNPQATGSATAGAAPTVSLWAIGGVILLSIAAAMFLAAMVGLIVPMLLHAMKLDPKLAAGPLVLMLADSLAMVLYLGLATWWLL
jgi:magnesium transporter